MDRHTRSVFVRYATTVRNGLLAGNQVVTIKAFLIGSYDTENTTVITLDSSCLIGVV